jgi:hypothetical protein
LNINICTLLLGEKREELVKNVIVSSNGSAKHYVNSLVTEMHLAGEDVQQYEDSKKWEDVVRKALHEYKNKDLVS